MKASKINCEKHEIENIAVFETCNKLPVLQHTRFCNPFSAMLSHKQQAESLQSRIQKQEI